MADNQWMEPYETYESDDSDEDGPYYLPWQSVTENPVERIRHAFWRRFENDITIDIVDSETKEIGTFDVHRIILAMTSPVLSDIVYEETEDVEDDDSYVDEFVITDITISAFQSILRYAYLNCTKFQNIHHALDTAHAANKFLMLKLRDSCDAFIRRQITLIRQNSYPKSTIHAMISDDVFKFLKSKCFLILTRRRVEEILQALCLDSRPVAVFQGVLRWSRARCIKEGMEESGLNIKCQMMTLFGLINFLAMTQQEFLEHVVPSKVLTSKESNGIFSYLRSPHSDIGSLPSWCKPITYNNYKLSCYLIYFQTAPRRTLADSSKHQCDFSVFASNIDLKIYLIAVSVPNCLCENSKDCELAKAYILKQNSSEEDDSTSFELQCGARPQVGDDHIIPSKYFLLNKPFELKPNDVYSVKFKIYHFGITSYLFVRDYCYLTKLTKRIAPERLDAAHLYLTVMPRCLSAISWLHFDIRKPNS